MGVILVKSKTPAELVDEIYPTMRPGLRVEDIQNTAILTLLNKDVDNFNEIAMAKSTGREFQPLYSEDSVVDNKMLDRYSEEYLNGINVAGMPKHRIVLKKGTPIILLRNLNPTQGLCNGTRLRVDHASRYMLKATIITGKNIRRQVLIPRISLSSKVGRLAGFQLQRKQFPIRIAYAMTINKSQGQTLRNVGLYWPNSVFGHGQLYVALSRVGDPNMIKVLVRNTKTEAKVDKNNDEGNT